MDIMRAKTVALYHSNLYVTTIFEKKIFKKEQSPLCIYLLK